MRQYDRILTSYRIPGLGKDSLKTWDAKLKNQDEHIIVMTNRYVSLLLTCAAAVFF
jgi:hypothetical protein